MRFRKIIALLLGCLMLLTVLTACDTTNHNNGVTDGDDVPAEEIEQNDTSTDKIEQDDTSADKTEQENNDGDEPLPCLKNFYPWMNELRVDAITQVRYEHGYIGVAPGSLTDISYSTNSEDIAKAYGILDYPVLAISREEGEVCGGSYVQYDFFTGGNTTMFSIRINNKILCFNGQYYRFVDNFYKPQYSYLDCHSFITYWGGYEIYTYATESVKIGDYDGLGELKFALYDGFIENAPSFRLIGDGVELLIFSSDLFAIKGDYNTVTYQIIGDKDFSFLFTTNDE